MQPSRVTLWILSHKPYKNQGGDIHLPSSFSGVSSTYNVSNKLWGMRIMTWIPNCTNFAAQIVVNDLTTHPLDCGFPCNQSPLFYPEATILNKCHSIQKLIKLPTLQCKRRLSWLWSEKKQIKNIHTLEIGSCGGVLNYSWQYKNGYNDNRKAFKWVFLFIWKIHFSEINKHVPKYLIAKIVATVLFINRKKMEVN